MTFPRTGAGNSLVGSLHAVDGKAVVRMEDRFSTKPDDLWSALTDPQRLARWIAKVEGDLRLGGEFRASFTSGWERPGAGRRVRASPPAGGGHVSRAGRPDRHRGRARSCRWPNPAGAG